MIYIHACSPPDADKYQSPQKYINTQLWDVICYPCIHFTESLFVIWDPVYRLPYNSLFLSWHAHANLAVACMNLNKHFKLNYSS